MTVDWAHRFAGADLELSDVYETVLLPRLFAPWAEHLLDVADPRPGSTLVDVATGPGTVARAAARRLGAAGRVIGCDLSAGMLAAAARHAAEPGAAEIAYLECPADALDLADATADLITCQHGLQFFPDRVAALTEMRRAARRDARLAVAVWAGIEHSPVLSALALGIASSLGGDAARGYVAGPWALTDPVELVSLARAAGWRDAEVLELTHPIEFDGGPAQLVASLGVTPLGPRVVALDPAARQQLIDAVAYALGDALEPDGAARGPATALVLTATR